jgi:hypothetical protein
VIWKSLAKLTLDKSLQAACERKRRPPQMQYQPRIDDCVAQVTNAIMAVDAMMDADQPYLLLGASPRR